MSSCRLYITDKFADISIYFSPFSHEWTPWYWSCEIPPLEDRTLIVVRYPKHVSEQCPVQDRQTINAGHCLSVPWSTVCMLCYQNYIACPLVDRFATQQGLQIRGSLSKVYVLRVAARDTFLCDRHSFYTHHVHCIIYTIISILLFHCPKRSFIWVVSTNKSLINPHRANIFGGFHPFFRELFCMLLMGLSRFYVHARIKANWL